MLIFMIGNIYEFNGTHLIFFYIFSNCMQTTFSTTIHRKAEKKMDFAEIRREETFI